MSVRYRQFAASEAETVGRLFAATFNDVLAQRGLPPYVDLGDPTAWAAAWVRDRRSLFEHLTATGSASWLAEEGGRPVGYARAVTRDGVVQLTDFFVLPGAQGHGIGKVLLERAFAGAAPGRRMVIATTDGAALARYLKLGLYPRCAVLEVHGRPQPAPVPGDLQAEPGAADAGTLDLLNRIDREILGYAREVDHRWLLADRSGFVYRRGGRPVGYGYVGRWCGPFAVLDPADLPAVLCHAETAMAGRGEDFLLMVPLANHVALDHAVRRGFRLATEFGMHFMSDGPEPRFANYLFSLPGFFT
jgi:GNAT superfamily N-acetyltransferase